MKGSALGTSVVIRLLACTVLVAAAGCSNITRYVQGTQPLSALPVPEWSIEAPAMLAEAFLNDPSLTFSAVVDRIETGAPAAMGFKLHLKEVMPDEWQAPEISITFKAWTEIRPMLRPGTMVSVRVRNGTARGLMVLDEDGLVFEAFVGEIFPGADESGPLHFTTSHEPAYFQAERGTDLCGKTWIHSKISVSTDLATMTMSPGARAAIRGSLVTGAWNWLVASADSVFIDESDCPEIHPSTAFFVILRRERAEEGADDFKGLKKITR